MAITKDSILKQVNADIAKEKKAGKSAKTVKNPDPYPVYKPKKNKK